MRLSHLFVIAILIGSPLSCSHRKVPQSDTRTLEVSDHVIIVSDDVPMPPEDLKTKFKTTREWLFNLCDDWTRVACVGAEDWQWLPFCSGKTEGIEPNGSNAVLWRRTMGLTELNGNGKV